jgi:hypothetical protein
MSANENDSRLRKIEFTSKLDAAIAEKASGNDKEPLSCHSFSSNSRNEKYNQNGGLTDEPGET